MSNIDELPPLRDIISQFDLAAKKTLGQNFILDLNLTSKIARSAGDFKGHDVLEVGPGPGGLTRALLACGAEKVIAIARDPRCLPALQQISDYYPGRLKVIEGDAMEVNLNDLSSRPVKIVANLPYNVATPLLTGWLSFRLISRLISRQCHARATPREFRRLLPAGSACLSAGEFPV